MVCVVAAASAPWEAIVHGSTEATVPAVFPRAANELQRSADRGGSVAARVLLAEREGSSLVGSTEISAGAPLGHGWPDSFLTVTRAINGLLS